MERYITKENGIKVDILWKPYMLQELWGLGLTNHFISFVGLENAFNDYSARFDRRIRLLRSRNFLTVRTIKRKIGGKYMGGKGGIAYAYSFGSIANAYLKKYGSFTNPKGFLMRPDKDIKESKKEKQEIKVVEKPVYVDKAISKSEEEAEW